MKSQGTILVILSIAAVVSAGCTDDQIQKYFGSSPNYHRIVQAVFPATRPPSVLIKIEVRFVNESQFVNSSCSDAGYSEYYTWSKACLYVSGGHISLNFMRFSSLGTIWPQRRQEDLCITLPENCRGDLQDQQDKMVYFLSKLESIAVRPTVPDPRMNTAKCITRGHGKATFTGVKQCLGGLCWMILLAALLFTLPAFWLLMHVQWKAELKKEENKREQSDSPDSNEMRALASSYPVEETPNPADSTDMGALKRAVIATGAAQKAVDELKQQSEARAGASTAEQATSTEAPAAVPKPPSSNGNGKSNLTETDSMILEMAKTATKATAEATEKAKGATKSIPRWEKIAEAASKADAAAAVVKVASERIEALKRDAPVGMMARSAADLAKLATAAAEEEAKEKVAKEAKVATREAVVLLLWLFTCASLVATLVLTVFAFHYDGQKSVAEDNCCPIAYLVITCAFFIYSCFYCSCKCCPRCCGCYELVSWYYIIVLPSIFIIIHHLLWVFFGMITEPFWALPLLLAISSASFTLYQFACLHRKVHSDVTRCKEILTKYETWFFSLSFLTLCLVLFNITLVGQAFFSDNVVAVIVQSLLTFVITLWLKELSAKYD